MGWRHCKLGDVARVKSGFAFKSKDWTESGVPVIKIQNVRGGRVLLEGCSYISAETAARSDRYRLNKDDVLITMSGEIGAVGVVRTDDHMMLNQRVGRLELAEHDRSLLRFLAYWLQQNDMKQQMELAAYGAAQANISPKLLAELPVSIPPQPELARVVTVLDAIDDLIENNRRRIEVLEEMAQAIYREWFVHFRFPGHENASFVDSPLGPIPEGWRVESIARVCKRIQSGGTPKRSESSYWLEGTVDWYKTGDLTDSILLGSSEQISSAAVEDGGARMFEPETILMAIYGSPTVGRLGLVREASSANQAALGLVANDDVVSTVFLWFSLRQQRDYFNQIAQGAAQQNISKKKVADALILVPASTIVSDFSLAAESTWRLSHELARQNTALESARDLLLPKLVSGEIDVSDLDLDAVLEGVV